MSNKGFTFDFEKEEEASGLPTQTYPAGPLGEENFLHGNSSPSANPPPSTFGPVGLGYSPWNIQEAGVPLPFSSAPPPHYPGYQAAPSVAPLAPLAPALAHLLHPVPTPTASTPSRQRTRMLTNLPQVRAIPWRQGQDAAGNKLRSSQHYALDLVVKGTVAAVPCTQCAAGTGKFSVCVVLAGQIGGACASCKFKERNLYCSLYTG